MGKKLKYNEFMIERVFSEREINFIVFNKEGYFCRLVPGENGFQISRHDKSLENLPDQHILNNISEFIASWDE